MSKAGKPRKPKAVEKARPGPRPSPTKQGSPGRKRTKGPKAAGGSSVEAAKVDGVKAVDRTTGSQNPKVVKKAKVEKDSRRANGSKRAEPMTTANEVEPVRVDDVVFDAPRRSYVLPAAGALAFIFGNGTHFRRFLVFAWGSALLVLANLLVLWKLGVRFDPSERVATATGIAVFIGTMTKMVLAKRAEVEPKPKQKPRR